MWGRWGDAGRGVAGVIDGTPETGSGAERILGHAGNLRRACVCAEG